MFERLMFIVVLSAVAPMAYGSTDNPEGDEDSDAMMIYLKNLRWTETESCLPLVELECPQIIGFLREYIFPIYRNNNGDKDYDRIYLIITEEDSCTQIRLLLYLHDKGELTGDSFWKGYKHSVAVIDDIRVIVISEKTCPYIKSKGDRTVCFKAIKDLHAINDACAEWDFELRNNNLVFTYFSDWGISLLKKLKRETYVPGFRPIKKSL